MADNKDEKSRQKKTAYTMEDAMKIADDIFALNSEKKYNVGAFIYGLAFALEYAVFSYKIPQQQIAMIKRDCRKYLKEMEKLKKNKD